MDPDNTFKWVEIAERFGVSFFMLVMAGLGIIFFSRWAAPIIRDVIDRQVKANEQRAEAAVLNAKASVENASTLTRTAERSLEIQKENAENVERMATVFESIVPILRRIDTAVFPNKKTTKQASKK